MLESLWVRKRTEKRIKLGTVLESFIWNFRGNFWSFLGINLSTVSSDVLLEL